MGRALNGLSMVPFVVPIVFDGAGRLVLDTVLLEPKLLSTLFSSTRASFLADIDVPSTWPRNGPCVSVGGACASSAVENQPQRIRLRIAGMG